MSWRGRGLRPLGTLPVSREARFAQPLGLFVLDSLHHVPLFKRPLAGSGGRADLAEMAFSLLARRLVV